MKGWLPEDVLDGLGGEWLSLRLDTLTDPDWLETRKGRRPWNKPMVKLDRKVRDDVAAVHAALQAERPTGPASAEGMPALSAGNVEAVERGATSSVPRARRSGRSHYLYWLLCRLETLGLLTFTLPARARELPPRALGFDALAAHLPLPTRFNMWQRHLASRALDVRPLRGREGASPREREYLALATLFAFGGPCGRGALATAARVETGDIDLAAGTVWLRDSAGERILNLTLHPVQVLSMHSYVRGARGAGVTPDGAAFPSVGTKAKQRTFGKWVGRELMAADSAAGHVSAHAAPAGLKALLAGAHRWALEIYPVYLASLLAGRFSGAVIDRASSGGRRRRRGTDDPENIPPSGEEKRLRAALRRAAVSVFQMVNSVNGVGVGHLADDWRKEIKPPAEMVPPQARSAAARAWNLFLLTRALIRMLYEGEADRYSTVERWLYTGYALLDELGGRPAWMMPEGEHGQLVASFPRKDWGLVRLTLEQMARAAGEHGPGALPLLAAAVNSGGRDIAVQSDAAEAAAVRRARHAPSLEQIDRMARLLLDDARRPPRRKNSAAPLDVLLYLDLLAVGARKSEALQVQTRDVISLDGAVAGADLVIKGEKTPAAYRLVPLDLHPNRGSAERIAAAAPGDEEERLWRNLLESGSGNRYWRRGRSRKDWVPPQFSFSRLDHALKKLGERVGIDGLSPHDLRRASITACLLAGVPPELIAKYHGHEDLPTTFEHYVFGLSAVQARDLGSFLSREENQVWVAITDAVQLLGDSKQAVYKRYKLKNPKVRVSDSPDAPGLVLERSGLPRYVSAVDLAAHVRRRQRRVATSTR